MYLKIKLFVIFITIGNFFSCKEAPLSIQRIDAKQIILDSAINETAAISSFITPYRNRVNAILDSTLALAPTPITKTDGTYNSSAGNLMADIVLSEANAVFKSRTGHDIDFVLLNHGGIRADISSGKVSARTAYEVMPFENSIVVVELPGAAVLQMIEFLIQSKRAHPIAGMQIILDKENQLKSLKIQGSSFSESKNYFVATSNYLVTGGDNMQFFNSQITVTDTDYLIRNAMIDYFKKVDTLKAVIDDRFYKINE